MTPQLNLSEPSLTTQSNRVIARRATHERAQSQQLSASFDEQLRKKHHIGSDDDSKVSTDTGDIVAKSPGNKHVGEATKLSDGDRDESDAASHTATDAEGGASVDQVEDQSVEAPTQTSAVSEAETTEAHGASEKPVDVGDPIVVADLRPVTMRSLNRLLLSGDRPQKLADERNVGLSTQTSVANEAMAKDEARNQEDRSSNVDEAHSRSPLDPSGCMGREATDDQHATSTQLQGEHKAHSSRGDISQNAENQVSDKGRAEQKSQTTEQQPQQPPIALPVVGAMRNAGDGDSAEGTRTSGNRDPLIGLRGLDRIAGNRVIDRAQIRQSSPTTPSRAQNDESLFAMSLTRSVAAAIKQGSGSITIRLRPEVLGQLKISIDLRTDRATGVEGRNPNMVSAHFEATTVEAKALLIRAMPSLREALFERGLDVQTLEVAVAAADDASSDQRDRPSEVRVRSGTRNARATIDNDQSDGDRLAEIHGGVEESKFTNPLVLDEMVESEEASMSLMFPINVDDETVTDDVGSDWIVGRGGNAGQYQIAIEDGGAARVVVDAIA